MHLHGFPQPISSYVEGWRRVAKTYARATFKDTAVGAAGEAQCPTNGILITLKPRQALKIIRYLANVNEAVFSGNLHVTSGEFVFTGANGAAATLANAFLAYGTGNSISNLSALASPAVIGEQVTPVTVALSVVDDWLEYDSVQGFVQLPLASLTLLSSFNVVNDGGAGHTAHVGELCQYEIWEQLGV